MYVSVQAGDGTVWAVGYKNEKGLFIWAGDTWEKIESAEDWPGSVLTMVASTCSPGVIYSIWGGPPQTAGNLTVLHVWRHEAGVPSKQLASFDNPTVDASNRNGERPNVTIDATDTLWLAFPGDKLVSLPSSGGEPRIIPVGRSLFVASAGNTTGKIRPLAYMPESAARGWLWTVQNQNRASVEGALFRPACVVDGRVTAGPPVTGLPAKGCVTWVSTPRDGRMVWALEGAGLWEIDLATMGAKPRPSPPAGWRILDWRALSDDLEVALVYGQGSRRDQLAGEVWVRRANEWINAGPRSVPHGGSRRSYDWQLWDGVLLGAGFYASMLHIDYSADSPIMRNLGWREQVNVRQPESMHVLRDGRLMIVGGGTLVAEAGALRDKWSVSSPQTAWTVQEQAVRAEDGRLWYLLASGPGTPLVKHWDGAAWQDWTLPGERSRWSPDSLWVDERGRVAVFSEDLVKPAWERDEQAPGGWRRWDSGRALVASRAGEPKPAATLYPLSEGFRTAPVLGEGGRALVRMGTFQSLAGGVWTVHTQRALGTVPFRYGFETDGTPWFHTNGQKRWLVADGVWADAGRVNEGRLLMSRTSEPWPEWLKARLDEQGADSAHRDGEGVWWVVQDGELWKGVDGEVIRVFSDDEPSPFRVGNVFYGVKTDPRGHRLFESGTNVLLPASPGPKTAIRAVTENLATDRRFVVSGGADFVRYDWRLNGAAWHRGEGDTLWLRELPTGVNVVELRGYNRRLDAGPVARVELRVDYDQTRRIGQLLEQLRSPVYETRTAAVSRLALHGAKAEPMLRAALKDETGETHRWWLRAALQVVEDRLTNP
jgi:hypothetical protein